MRLAASRGPPRGGTASRRAANRGNNWSLGQRRGTLSNTLSNTLCKKRKMPTLPINLHHPFHLPYNLLTPRGNLHVPNWPHGIRHGIRHGFLLLTSNDLNPTACSQGGAISDLTRDNVNADNVNAECNQTTVTTGMHNSRALGSVKPAVRLT